MSWRDDREDITTAMMSLTELPTPVWPPLLHLHHPTTHENNVFWAFQNKIPQTQTDNYWPARKNRARRSLSVSFSFSLRFGWNYLEYEEIFWPKQKHFPFSGLSLAHTHMDMTGIKTVGEADVKVLFCAHLQKKKQQRIPPRLFLSQTVTWLCHWGQGWREKFTTCNQSLSVGTEWGQRDKALSDSAPCYVPVLVILSPSVRAQKLSVNVAAVTRETAGNFTQEEKCFSRRLCHFAAEVT